MDAASLVRRHPLQRLNSPSRNVSALVHAVGLVSFAYAFYYLQYFPSQMSLAYGSHYQFLTIIGLTLAALTFCLAFLADLFLSPRLFFCKNAVAVMSAPLEVLIALLYWGISAIDRSLLAPPEMQLELFIDLVFHLFPALLLLFDILLLSPPWTFGVLPALSIPAFIATAYWFWLDHCFSHNGFYPYPLLGALDVYYRVLLFASSALTMAAGTLALRLMYMKFNGNLNQGTSVPGNVKGTKGTQ